MEFFILGIQWLNTENEMDNINVHGIKEEENTAVEAQEDHVNEEGRGKDIYEKVEGLYSENSPEGRNLPAAKQTSVGQAKEVTLATESEPHTAQPHEFKSNNQDKHSGAQMELLRESYPTDANKNSLGTEENQNLDETSVSECNMDRAASQGKLLGSRITKDRPKTGTKDDVENGLDNKCSQEVLIEVNLSRKAISKGTSSNTFEEVPPIQDKTLILNENKETIESKSENETNAVETNSSQSEFVMFGSVSRNGKENVESRELTELTPIMVTVPRELPTMQRKKEEEEETEQIEEKIIETIQEKKENPTAVGIIKEAREKPKLDAGILQSASNEAVDIAVAELRTSPRFNFDLSMEERFEESYQSPLLHNKKIETQWFYQLSKPDKGLYSFSRRGKRRSGKKQFGLVKI